MSLVKHLLNVEKIYREECFVSAGEANPEQELSLPILVAKFIDIATAHANSLEIGNPAMTDMNAGWVLSRLTIEMTEYPKVNESYVMETWIVDFNRHYSEREFSIKSPDGKVYGYGRSIWMVMSTVDHTNVGLSHLQLPEGMITGRLSPIERQARHLQIVSPDFADALPKGALIANCPVFDYKFKYCDLDGYRHVNTVRYVELLLNRFSLKELDDAFVSRLELSFMHEARYGMETQLLRFDDCDKDMTRSSFLLKEKDGENLFFARMFRRDRVMK